MSARPGTLLALLVAAASVTASTTGCARVAPATNPAAAVVPVQAAPGDATQSAGLQHSGDQAAQHYFGSRGDR